MKSYVCSPLRNVSVHVTLSFKRNSSQLSENKTNKEKKKYRTHRERWGAELAFVGMKQIKDMPLLLQTKKETCSKEKDWLGDKENSVVSD